MPQGKTRTTTTTGRQWWQRLLLYPTFAGAVLSAIPGMWDRAMAVYHETGTASFSFAETQLAMWQRNADCASQDFSAYRRLSNMEVGTTVCPSGDLFVRVSMPRRPATHHWVALQDILQNGPGLSLIPAAHAAPASWSLLGQIEAGAARGFQQGPGHVICQRMISARHIVRRIQTPQGCFDEVVDMMNGGVVRRTPVPCNPSC